jgi:hypothetical protein
MLVQLHVLFAMQDINVQTNQLNQYVLQGCIALWEALQPFNVQMDFPVPLEPQPYQCHVQMDNIEHPVQEPVLVVPQGTNVMTGEVKQLYKLVTIPLQAIIMNIFAHPGMDAPQMF